MRALLALVLTAVLAVPAAATPGGLDRSFGGDGRIAVPAAGPFVARAVELDRAGRIVVAGYRCQPSTMSKDGTCLSDGDSSFRLARFTHDGGLDPEFGASGIVTTPVGEGRSQAYDVVIQRDGRIVVAGVAREQGRDVFAVARYLDDGSLDDSFGSGGIALIPVGNAFASAGDIALGPDGTLLLAGQAVDADGRPSMAVVRLTATGLPDPVFGTGGATLGGGPFGYATALAVGTDGTIFVAGIAGGSADPDTFGFGALPVGANGRAGRAVTYRLGASASFANAVISLPGAAWLAAGAATVAGHQQMVAARLTSSGALDPAYGTRGVALRPVLDGAVANDIARDTSGRVVLVGQAAVGAGYRFASVRLRANGAADPTYGSGGTSTVSWSAYPIARATSGAIQRDGRLVTVGLGCADGVTSKCTGGTAVLLLARQLGGPALPKLTVGKTPAHVTRAALRHGIHVTVRLRTAARVDATLTGHAKRGGRAVRVAHAHPKAARTTVTVALHAGAAALARVREGSLQLTVRAGGATAHRRITLR